MYERAQQDHCLWAHRQCTVLFVPKIIKTAARVSVIMCKKKQPPANVRTRTMARGLCTIVLQFRSSSTSSNVVTVRSGVSSDAHRPRYTRIALPKKCAQHRFQISSTNKGGPANPRSNIRFKLPETAQKSHTKVKHLPDWPDMSGKTADTRSSFTACHRAVFPPLAGVKAIGSCYVTTIVNQCSGVGP